MLGLTDEELADAFGVSFETITKWKQKYPEFRKQVRKGKQEADSHVAESLYKSACGFTAPEEKVFCNAQGEVTRVRTEKYYPPNINAAKFWLKSRQKELWRELWNVEHTGSVSQPIEFNRNKVDLSDFTDDELKLLESIQDKMGKKLGDDS